MNAPMAAMIALWILTVLTLRGLLIAPVVWATLEMDVIVQVGMDTEWNGEGGNQLLDLKRRAFLIEKHILYTWKWHTSKQPIWERRRHYCYCFGKARRKASQLSFPSS